ncbi:MAG: response regulator transcription factor [Clostridium sp.]|nr:response regulator transcription factor [Clostridium sp.]
MGKNKILVIEDEDSIRELLAMNLEAVGYEVDLAVDGVEAEEKIRRDEGSCDLALVDVMLPGPDGFDLIEWLNKKEIPCIYLTAKADVASKVKGLRLGAEDYMVKPFEMMELFARVENVLKRRRKLKDFIELGDCRIDLAGHKVFEEGREISLKPMEYDLFLFLCRNQNVAFTRNQLLDKIWGGGYGGETRTVDVHVASLRKKLKAGSRIRTIPKLGYRLEV